MKKVLFFATVTLVLFSCSKDKGSGSGNPGPNEVWMQNIRFNPAVLTVDVGTTVVWTNKDNVDHTVTEDGSFDSGLIHPGGTFNHTFSSEGTFDYRCTVHSDMTGSVIVQAVMK